MHNPWLARLDLCTDPDFIRSRASLTPKPLVDVNARSPDEALAALTRAFDQTYYATDAACGLIADLIAHARTGIATRYTTPGDFIKALYDGKVPEARVAPICITGLAGVGKSELLAACLRVLPDDEMIELEDSHSAFAFQSMWHIQLSARQSIRPMLEDIASQASTMQRPGKTIDKTRKLLRHLAYRNGVALLAADEFQFVNQGSNANTVATRMLLMLNEIGTALVYAANYSLVHRLKRRYQEDRQRLLSSVRLLERADYGSQDWRGLVQSYIDVVPDVLRIEPLREANRLWTLTAGLPRNLRYLLCTAYAKSRTSGQFAVTIETCEAAYRSDRFSLMREDVELLHTQAISGKPVKGRADLNPPFIGGQMAPEHAKDHLADRQAREQVKAHLLDAMTLRERAGYQKSTASRSSSTAITRKQGPAGKGDMMEGLELFRKFQKPRKGG